MRHLTLLRQTVSNNSVTLRTPFCFTVLLYGFVSTHSLVITVSFRVLPTTFSMAASDILDHPASELNTPHLPIPSETGPLTSKDPNVVCRRFKGSKYGPQECLRHCVSQQQHKQPAEPGSSSLEQPTNLLVVSPYTSSAHLLDLTGLSKPNQLLAKALTVLRPVREDYATVPYIHAFNWIGVVQTLRELVKCQINYHWQDAMFFIVVFRSRRPPTTDALRLGHLDQLSHAEAMKSGGLLKYWFGTPDQEGRNLATCRSKCFHPRSCQK